MEPQPMDNSAPLTDGFNFTPIFNGKRVKMRARYLSNEMRRMRGPGVRGFILDSDTGKTYRVDGRACELPDCFCDAEIFEVEG